MRGTAESIDDVIGIFDRLRRLLDVSTVAERFKCSIVLVVDVGDERVAKVAMYGVVVVLNTAIFHQT